MYRECFVPERLGQIERKLLLAGSFGGILCYQPSGFEICCRSLWLRCQRQRSTQRLTFGWLYKISTSRKSLVGLYEGTYDPLQVRLPLCPPGAGVVLSPYILHTCFKIHQRRSQADTNGPFTNRYKAPTSPRLSRPVISSRHSLQSGFLLNVQHQGHRQKSGMKQWGYPRNVIYLICCACMSDSYSSMAPSSDSNGLFPVFRVCILVTRCYFYLKHTAQWHFLTNTLLSYNKHRLYMHSDSWLPSLPTLATS